MLNYSTSLLCSLYMVPTSINSADTPTYVPDHTTKCRMPFMIQKRCVILVIIQCASACSRMCSFDMNMFWWFYGMLFAFVVAKLWP